MQHTQGLRPLVQRLIALGNQNQGNQLGLVASELAASPPTLRSIRDYYLGLKPDEREAVLAMSIERSTHHKWCIASSGHRRARIWLHVYKEWNGETQDFAASIHNHRYSFVSMVLQGGIRERRWHPHGQNAVTPGSVTKHHAGSVYLIEWSEIHSIESVDAGTMTLVAQMGTHRNFSSVYSPLTLTRERQIYDLEDAFDRMIDRVLLS